MYRRFHGHITFIVTNFDFILKNDIIHHNSHFGDTTV